MYFFFPEPLTGLTNGGNDYGYSQWHYQEDDRFGWSAAAALTRVALLMALRVDLRLLLVAVALMVAAALLADLVTTLSMSKE